MTAVYACPVVTDAAVAVPAGQHLPVGNAGVAEQHIGHIKQRRRQKESQHPQKDPQPEARGRVDFCHNSPSSL